MQLRPEVAERFALTTSSTLIRVPRLGQDVDLTQIDVVQAEELLALPGGFEWLRRLEPTVAPDLQTPETSAGPAEATADPAKKGKNKKGS